MFVKMRIGYATILVEMSGAELEVFTKIASKMTQCDVRFLEGDPELKREGDYAFVKESDKPPHFGIEILTEAARPISQADYEKANASAKEAQERAKQAE